MERRVLLIKVHSVDLEPIVNLSYNQDSSRSSSSAASKLQTVKPEKKAVVALLLKTRTDDIKPKNIRAQWNDLYTEGSSLIQGSLLFT